MCGGLGLCCKEVFKIQIFMSSIDLLEAAESFVVLKMLCLQLKKVGITFAANGMPKVFHYYRKKL